VEKGFCPDLLYVPSLHVFLSKSLHFSLNIIPIGKLNKAKLRSILLKHSSIRYFNKENAILNKDNYPCGLYSIYKRSFNVYGVPSFRKRGMKFDNLFNKYKKVSVNPKFNK
jgi:hypothetical protein